MNLLFKKAIVPLGAIASISLPAVMAVSCGNSSHTPSDLDELSGRDFSKKYDFKDIWSHFRHSKYKEIVIKKWIDGDTLIYQDASDANQVDPNSHPADGSNPLASLPHLRISSIDTPESHVKNDSGNWVDTTGIEKVWADKATDFGDKTIPVGTTARLLMEAGSSHSRDVGNIFYGDNYEHSYSVDILRAGLALNFINNVNYMNMSSHSSPLHYLGIPLADGYNYAKTNRIGLHSIDPSEVSKIHGTTSFIPVLYNPANVGSVYHYMDDDFWKE